MLIQLQEKVFLLTIASNLLLPLIFIGGLIFFFQNSDNFSPNSGSSPMNLGKSPARFDQNQIQVFHLMILQVLMKLKLNLKKLFHF
jgi:ATP-dependent Zn protease